MRRIILLIILLAFTEQIHAQLRLGVVASYGISSSRSQQTQLGTDQGRLAYEIAFLEHQSIPSVGLGFYYESGFLFFMSEAHYRKNAYTLRVKNYMNIDERMNYLEETASTVHIPVTGGLKFGSVKVGVGPIFNFQIDRSKALVTAYEIQDRSRNLQMGFAGLIGLDLSKHFSINFKYEHSFSRIGDDYRYRGKTLPIHSKLDYITFNVAMFL